MDIKTKEIYSEVYGILNMLGNNYIMKLPSSLYKMIEEEKSNEYNPKYDSKIALEEQNIRRESISMIALFHLNYWCSSNKEKENLRTIFKDNETKYQTELRQKYNPDSLFKRQSSEQSEQKESSIAKEVAMVEYKESILKKFINKIKNILHLS